MFPIKCPGAPNFINEDVSGTLYVFLLVLVDVFHEKLQKHALLCVHFNVLKELV